MTARMEKGKRWFKFVLMLVAVGAGVKGCFAIGHPDAGNKLAQALLQFIGGAIFFAGPAFALGWLAGKEEPSKPDDSATVITTGSPSSGSPPVPAEPARPEVRQFDEDAAYSQALKEVESGTVEQAIWSRAFAETEGVDSKARALSSNFGSSACARRLRGYDAEQRSPHGRARERRAMQGPVGARRWLRTLGGSNLERRDP